MKKNAKIYFVWNEDEKDSEFWEQFETIEDAVSSEGDGCEIYVVEPPKLIGKFKRKVEMIKIKTRRKKRQ